MVRRWSEPEGAEAARTTHYVLCHGPRVESCAGCITVFDTENEARFAFMRAHQNDLSRTGWAQVIAIDPDGNLRVVSWFGRPSAPLVPEPAIPAPAAVRSVRS